MEFYPPWGLPLVGSAPGEWSLDPFTLHSQDT